MTTRSQSVNSAVEAIRSKIPDPPEVALILGSGLGDFADQLHDSVSIHAGDIPHYPRASVEGHAGTLVFGRVRRSSRDSVPLLVFKGRVHYYESGTLAPTLFPVSLAHALGASTLIVTNAAGGINRSFTPGDLMLITDYISFSFVKSEAEVIESESQASTLQSRFGAGDAVRPLDTHLQEQLRKTAAELSLDLKEGTYCWVHGPSYETAAEIEMLRRVGSDAVGMSTVPEVSLALRLGMRVAGISLISNLATGISSKKLSHDEVTETANKVKARFSDLLTETLLRL